MLGFITHNGVRVDGGWGWVRIRGFIGIRERDWGLEAEEEVRGNDCVEW